MSILLAEDDSNFGRILKTELEEDNCTVDLVPNGVEAVLSFFSKNYDMVLLDIRMPRLNGTDTMRIMKKMKPQIPIITFSGNAGSDEIAESIELGAIKCFTKPFEVSQLRSDIMNHISK